LKSKAEDLLNQLKKGANFADLAAKNSEDTGTAARGGDVGWVVRGQITEPEFENAAFSLKPGAPGEVVTTRFGYHVVQVTAHEPARVRSLDEVKGELMAEAQKAQGEKDLATAAAACRAEVAKAPTQAEAIAKKYGLKFYHVDKWTARDKAPSVGGLEVLLYSAFLQTPKGGVSQIETSPTTSDAGFVVMGDILPARPAEYAEVEKEVEKKYRNEEATRMFNDWVAQATDRIVKKNESVEAVAKAMQGTYGTSAPFARNGAAEGIGRASLLKEAFNKKPGEAFGPVEVPGVQYIVRVKEKTPATSFTATDRLQAGAALSQKAGEMVGPLYRDSVLMDLERRGVVKINRQLIRKVAESVRTS
jgi:peptidyl-prolyl cis-trans isomerase D